MPSECKEVDEDDEEEGVEDDIWPNWLGLTCITG